MLPTQIAAQIPLLDDPNPQATGSLGALQVRDGDRLALLPLKAVAITARVVERVADVTMTQTFRNEFSTALEAVYIFPLPGEAAVRDFVLRVGDRVLRGAVQERAEARRAYQQALAEGRRAALLEQERDDIFTVQVGNLPPGEEVTVELTYARQLPFFEDGATELRLPMVVAPRYIPGTPLDRAPVGDGIEIDSDVVPDASRISPPRLASGSHPQVALSIDVELGGAGKPEAGQPTIAELACSQHATRTSAGDGRITVALAREDEPLIATSCSAGGWPATSRDSSLLVYRDESGAAYGAVSLVPPRPDAFLGVPRDVIFVVDRSGSMQGVKMASAARACALLLQTLGPRDRFAIAAFDNQVEWLEPADSPPTVGAPRGRLIAADQRGIERGERFLHGIDARGGTELYGVLGDAFSALLARVDGTGRAPVVVLLTDGQVGDEARILKRLQTELGEARVFTIGIDTAVNEAFLSRLAALGGGTATFVEPGAPLVEALRQVGREIGVPLATDFTLDVLDSADDASVKSLPALPDLFAGRAVTAFLHAAPPNRASAREAQPLRLRVRGRAAGDRPLEMLLKEQPVSMPAMAQLWARAQVRELEDRFRLEPGAQDTIRAEIVALAVEHRLLTRFTAFVVVDQQEVVNPDGTRTRVIQPVEMPDRWEMQMPMAAASGVFHAHAPGVAYAAAAMPPASPLPPVQFAGAMPTGSLPPVANYAGQAPTGGASGILKRVEERVRGIQLPRNRQQASPRSSARQNESHPPEKSSDAVSRSGRENVVTAIRTYAQAFEAARQALAAGHTPPPDSLEAARAALLTALTASDIAADCPLLQRFLRSAAVELTAALRAAPANTAALVPIFDRHHAAFQAACTQAAPYLELASATSTTPFWEAGV